MNWKQIWKPLLVLVVAFGILLGLSAVLEPVAEAKQLEHDQMVMGYLLMGSETFAEEPYTGEDTAITAVYKGETGYVVETTVDGYAAPMVLWVGVKNDGYVTGITVRDLDETPGLGWKTASDVDFLLQFLRSTGESAVGEDIDAVTGATVSSKAVTKAVNAAVGFVTGADVSSGATEWGG